MLNQQTSEEAYYKLALSTKITILKTIDYMNDYSTYKSYIIVIPLNRGCRETRNVTSDSSFCVVFDLYS